MNYLLLAQGESIGTARVLAVSADQRLVGRFARELVDEESEPAQRQRERAQQAGPLRLLPGGEATEH